jgi:hypothetical protein
MNRLFILPLFFSFLSFSQQTYVKGYIVQLSGDTMRGEVKINAKKEIDQFVRVAFKENSGIQRVYKADKLKAYGFETKNFIPGKNDGESVFYKVLSTGALELFELQYEVLQMNEIRVKSQYYIKKTGNEEYIKVKHNRFKKQITDLMGDNLKLVKEIDENKNLEMENMVEVFNQYNIWAKANKS